MCSSYGINHEIFQSSEDSRLLLRAAKHFPRGYNHNVEVPTALFNIQIIIQIATKPSEVKYLTNSLYGFHVADYIPRGKFREGTV